MTNGIPFGLERFESCTIGENEYVFCVVSIVCGTHRAYLTAWLANFRRIRLAHIMQIEFTRAPLEPQWFTVSIVIELLNF